MTKTSESIRLGCGNYAKLGDTAHLGLATLGGAGFTGTIIDIRGDHITLENDGRTWCGRSGLGTLVEE